MIGGGGADDGGSDRRKKRRAELEVAIKGTLAVQAYIRITCTIMAYLAFTWSTVVLLGGYVSSLQRKDFQCLTVITVIEATSLSNIDMQERAYCLVPGCWVIELEDARDRDQA
ncbi:hypothetical protein OsI_35436 [Oryza sativa Indica Group]|uniref:Uncharacterized protein n=5 Tax=Oryza TaxID=4527 RepID=Q53LG6_ORYSJ|nr:hypothetical protein LOC_Os11g09100 [Oryza sativa Japonica Group]ABA91882.1 hypothetical protein LOC_Os11g09100 [Oryza sativa Japonica Group]EAY80267.1 hypothetical protein OsI_35436 [Oryza sativa Indica Group]